MAKSRSKTVRAIGKRRTPVLKKKTSKEKKPKKSVKKNVEKQQKSSAVEKADKKTISAGKKTISAGKVLGMEPEDTKNDEPTSVIYMGHLPHGFFEPQLDSYLSQFGRIRRLRLARSKRTGGSKGYAFIEFYDADVAQIVAETMNNYLMFRRLIQCRVLQQSELHPKMFDGCDRIFYKPSLFKRRAVKEHNRARTDGQLKENNRKARGRDWKKCHNLKELGFNEELLKPVKIVSQDKL